MSLDNEQLEDLNPRAEVHALCTVTAPSGVTQGSAFSLPGSDGSAFFFAETTVVSGGTTAFLPNTEALADPSRPCELDYVRDATGALAVPIPLTSEEIAFDLARTDGRRTALWPRGGFVANDTRHVFYRKVALAGYFDVAEVGTGVARFTPGAPGERLTADKWPGEPLLTWVAPNSGWATGALLGNDGMAYVYGCYERAAFDLACRVARVEPEHVGAPDDYRYYSSDGEWTDRVERAASVFDQATHLSGFYSAYLERYVFVYSQYLDNRILMVTAPQPWGPFDEPFELTIAPAPQQFWIERADLHPGFGSADGRRFVFGYFTDNSAAPGLHLVEAVLQ